MAVADPMAGLEVLKGMPGDAKLVDGFEHIPEVEPSIARAGMGGLVPTAVNGIVLDRHRYLAPDPHNSTLRDAITKAYWKAGYEVGFVDHTKAAPHLRSNDANTRRPTARTHLGTAPGSPPGSTQDTR